MSGTRIVTVAHLHSLEVAVVAAQLEAATWREIAIQQQMRLDDMQRADEARERTQRGPETGWPGTPLPVVWHPAP